MIDFKLFILLLVLIVVISIATSCEEHEETDNIVGDTITLKPTENAYFFGKLTYGGCFETRYGKYFYLSDYYSTFVYRFEHGTTIFYKGSSISVHEVNSEFIQFTIND